MRRIQILLLALATVLAGPARAGIELAGTTGANFLTAGPGASMFGMGGTGIGGYPDLSAMSWNPASLALLHESELMLTHMPMRGSATQEWMAFGGQMGVAPTQWALTGRYEGDGSFEALDPLGNPTGTFNASSLALGVNASRSVDPRISIGLGAKFVNENLGAVSGYGGTFDLGVLFHHRGFGLGLAAQNIGGSIKYDSLAYSMPLNFGAGLSYSHAPSGLRFGIDMNHPSAYYNDVRLGMEWKYRGVFALRGGYRKELNAPSNDPFNGQTFGVGFGNHGLWLDYGYASAADGTSEQRITVRMSPKDWGITFAEDETGTKPSQADQTAALAPPPAPVQPQPAPTQAPPAPATIQPQSAPGPTATSAPPATSTPSPASGTAMGPAAASAPPVVVPPPTPAPKPAVAPAPSMPTPAAVMAPPPSPTPKTVSSTPAPTPAVSAPVAVPPPAAPSPGTELAPPPAPASSAPAKVEPDAAPSLTALVPTAPPVSPAPKPVETRKTSMPGVSAPATETRPVEAPVTEVAPASPAAAPKKITRIGGTALAPPPPMTAAPALVVVTKSGKPVQIHVKKGETLESIAKEYGTTAAAIMMENNLVTMSVKPGQSLKIPNHQ